jgi:hypothetical protein
MITFPERMQLLFVGLSWHRAHQAPLGSSSISCRIGRDISVEAYWHGGTQGVIQQVACETVF